MIELFVHGEPVAQGRPRFRQFKGKGPDAKSFVSTYDPSTSRGWKAEIAKAAKNVTPFIPGIPLSMKLVFYLPKPKSVKRLYPIVKPDLDNFIKAVMDALKDIWGDDCQVIQISAGKRYAGIGGIWNGPGVFIAVSEYKE